MGAEVQETSFGYENDAYDGEDGKTDNTLSTKGHTVSLRELFRFCGSHEKMLILFGTIGAVLHGGAFPTMIIFYGQMTENFVQWSICDEMVGQVNCREYFQHYGYDPGEINKKCTNKDFTFALQFMNKDKCSEESIVVGGSSGDYFGRDEDYCFNTLDGLLTPDSTVKNFRQTNPGNGETVFRAGCMEKDWRNWVTRCNSCGVKPDATDEKLTERYHNCLDRYDSFNPVSSYQVAKLDPYDEEKYGTVLCPYAVSANVAMVGQIIYEDDKFCKGANNNDPKREKWCTMESLNAKLEEFGPDGPPKDFEYSIFHALSSICIVFAIIATATVIAGYFQVMMYTKVATWQVHTLRQRFFKSIMGQEIGWFDVNAAGTLNSMLADDVSKISDGMGDKFAILLQKVACFVIGITFALVQGWQLALVIMGIIPFIVFGAGLLSRKVSQMTSLELKAYGKAGAVAEEVLSAIRTVNAFHGQGRETERYDDNLGRAQKQGIQKGKVNGLFLGYTWCVIFISFAVAFGIGALIFEYSADKITAVFYSVVLGALQLSQASPNIEAISVACGAAKPVYDIIDRKSKIDPFSTKGKTIPLDKFKGDIELKNIYFAYPSRPEENAVKNLNITFASGKTTAIVGPSGMGKSTIVQLIERFYDPQKGSVTVDGINIKDLNISWWRNMIGVVEQEPSLFNTTIYENIKYGKPDSTEDDIVEAAKAANAFNFIMDLPDGFQTQVGERGSQLSGGQKQRVAIARALIRKPRVLLFDQATSALDTESEAIVLRGIRKYREGHTTVLIAHRLSTIKAADIINGMEHGKVVESGTHAQLMEKTGVYFSLVTLQSQDKKSDDELAKNAVIESKIRSNSLGSRKSIKSHHSLNRESVTRVSSRMSRISHPMYITETANVVKEAFTDEKRDEFDEDNLPPTSAARLLSLNASEWPQLLCGSFSAAINGTVLPVCAWIISYILGYLGEVDQDAKREGIINCCIGFVVIAFIQLLTQFLQGYLFGVSGEKLTRRMRKDGFHAIVRQDIAFFDDSRNNTAALATKLQSDASMVQAAAGGQLGIVFSCLATIMIALGISFGTYYQLAFVVLFFFPLTAFTGIVQGKIWSGQALTDSGALEEAGKMVSEAVEMIRTVSAFNREASFDQKYNQEILPPRESGLSRAHFYGLMYGVSQSILFYAFSATFTFGGWLVQEHALTYEKVFRVFSAIIFGGTQLGRAAASAPDFAKAKDSSARIFRLLDRIPAYADPYSKEGHKWENFKGDIQFKNLQFTYPTRPDIQVLNGFDISIKSGQTLALVGQSGCGKSTCMQLLQRFYDTNGGAVLVDGYDTTKTNTKFLRSKIGIVAQEPTLFDETIGNNIKYGDLDNNPSLDQIIEASKIASLHDFIKDMPLGYDTPAGGGGGNQMSRGQKQRVAIARAIIRNPRILLLDEATSALDTESEKIVQAALDRAREGRTCIVIAHRLSTIRSADKIAVVNKGQLVEAGTHDELMKLQGAYYKLITMNVTLS